MTYELRIIVVNVNKSTEDRKRSCCTLSGIRFCKLFSESSTVVLQLPCCPGNSSSAVFARSGTEQSRKMSHCVNVTFLLASEVTQVQHVHFGFLLSSSPEIKFVGAFRSQSDIRK